jgi:hypothetical protein
MDIFNSESIMLSGNKLPEIRHIKFASPLWTEIHNFRCYSSWRTRAGDRIWCWLAHSILNIGRKKFLIFCLQEYIMLFLLSQHKFLALELVSSVIKNRHCLLYILAQMFSSRRLIKYQSTFFSFFSNLTLFPILSLMYN